MTSEKQLEIAACRPQSTQNVKSSPTLKEIESSFSISKESSSLMPRKEVLKAVRESLEKLCTLRFNSRTCVFPSQEEQNNVSEVLDDFEINFLVETYRHALECKQTFGAKINLDGIRYQAVKLDDRTAAPNSDPIVLLTKQQCETGDARTRAVFYSELPDAAHRAFHYPKVVDSRKKQLVSLYNEIQNTLKGPYYDMWLQNTDLISLLLTPSVGADTATLCNQLQANLCQYRLNVQILCSPIIHSRVLVFVKDCNEHLTEAQQGSLGTIVEALAS